MEHERKSWYVYIEGVKGDDTPRLFGIYKTLSEAKAYANGFNDSMKYFPDGEPGYNGDVWHGIHAIITAKRFGGGEQ